jgi:hypothetical protein
MESFKVPIGAKVSPSGKWVAFTSSESGNREVYVQAVPGTGGGAPQKFASHPPQARTRGGGPMRASCFSTRWTTG